MIDERAVIDPSAEIAADVKIGAYSVIGPNVTIGPGSEVGPHATIMGRTIMGRNNKIFQYASVGTDPQDIKYQGEDTRLEIGDNNIIREFCTVNRGTIHGDGATRIGNNTFLMAYTHIAHDCQIGNHVVLANNASLAGHVKVGDYTVFGGFAVVAQFCTIGAYSFIAGTTGVSKDIPPYIIVSSVHRRTASPYGLNLVGLKRHGFSDKTIRQLKRAYHVIYQEGLTTADAVVKLRAMVKTCPEIQRFIAALEGSERGIVR